MNANLRFKDYEYTEQVHDLIKNGQKLQLGNVRELAIASAHGIAFHRGLGEPVWLTSSTAINKYLSHDSIGAYSTLAYRKPNIAIVGNGVDHGELSKWVGEYFKDMRTTAAEGVPNLEEGQTKYFGGEERIAHGNGNALVIAFPGSSSLTGGFYKPEISILATLLGGKSTIKWSPGFSLLGKVSGKHSGVDISTHSAIYSDAGLLYTVLQGNAGAVRDASFEVVRALKAIAGGELSNEDFEKARALAKFKELEYGQDVLAGLELTGTGLVHEGKPYQLDESAQKIGEVSKEKLQEVCLNPLNIKTNLSFSEHPPFLAIGLAGYTPLARLFKNYVGIVLICRYYFRQHQYCSTTRQLCQQWVTSGSCRTLRR